VSSSSLQPILALLGDSLGGNPTQYMTEKAFRHHELDWRYLTLEVSPDDLGDAVRGMRAMGFRGGNITEPHKQAVVALLERTSRAAGLIGVVNVISRDDEGLVGENTEGKAMVEAIRRHTDPADARVVLLGAGRMARAVAVELALAGAAEITVVARKASRAAELAELVSGELKVSASGVAWPQDFVLPPETDILIHATSLARGDPDARVPLDLDSLTAATIVADATIDPDTRLLREARQRGSTTVDGVDVLSRQAAINFKLWTGMDPDLTVMREAVEEFLEL
jgi:shikimate dehydrogenase